MRPTGANVLLADKGWLLLSALPLHLPLYTSLVSIEVSDYQFSLFAQWLILFSCSCRTQMIEVTPKFQILSFLECFNIPTEHFEFALQMLKLCFEINSQVVFLLIKCKRLVLLEVFAQGF